MRRNRLIAVAGLLGLLAQPVLAFQESAPGSGAAKAPAGSSGDAQKGADPGKGLSLKMPDVSLGKGPGTEVRIPGIGTVGVLPKLDFGLELLYGATEGGGRPDEKPEGSDVQIRGTIKHRF